MDLIYCGWQHAIVSGIVKDVEGYVRALHAIDCNQLHRCYDDVWFEKVTDGGSKSKHRFRCKNANKQTNKQTTHQQKKPSSVL